MWNRIFEFINQFLFYCLQFTFRFKQKIIKIKTELFIYQLLFTIYISIQKNKK